LFLAILVLAWRTAGRLRRDAVEALVRADAAAIQVTLPLFGFYIFYRLALLESLSFQIVFAALLGYLAWLHRRHTRSATASQP
jgi:DNA-binding transcriptional regulator of glucitol operon